LSGGSQRTGSGTHSGKSVNVDGIWLHRLAAGKIVESWNCRDVLGMRQPLGVVPKLG